MRFVTTRECTTLAELVVLAYQIPAERLATITKRAERALLQANPQLRDVVEVPPGAVIAVPEVEGAEPSDEAAELETAVGRPLADQVREAFAGAVASLGEAVEREEAGTRETLELLRSRDVRRLAEEEPEVKERLAGIGKESNARLKAAEALRKELDAVKEQLGRDLEELLDALEAPEG
jgi:hypothetical protein